MKSFAKLSLFVAALGLAGAALAQDPGPKTGAPAAAPSQRMSRAEREKMTTEILEKLKLTDDQKSKFKAHQEEMKKKVAELRKSLKGAAPEERKEKMKSLRKENQDFMKKTLTKDQQKEYTKLVREKMKSLRPKSDGK